MNACGAFFRTNDDENIYYEVHGSGLPLVIVPGFLCTTRFFERNVAALSKENKVITLDCRSFGYSTKSGKDMTLARMATDVKELIDHLQLQDVTLLGWSMGGNVVMTYYDLFGPYQLRAIGTLDSTLYPYGDGAHNAHNLRGYNLEKFCDQMKLAYADYQGYCQNFARSLFKQPISAQDEEWIVNEAMKCPVSCAFALYQDFVHKNCERPLAQLTIPMLICGANSPRTPKGLEMARHYKSMVPSPCTYHEFLNAGHILFYECPEEFNQVVIDFISQLK